MKGSIVPLSSLRLFSTVGGDACRNRIAVVLLVGELLPERDLLRSRPHSLFSSKNGSGRLIAPGASIPRGLHTARTLSAKHGQIDLKRAASSANDDDKTSSTSASGSARSRASSAAAAEQRRILDSLRGGSAGSSSSSSVGRGLSDNERAQQSAEAIAHAALRGASSGGMGPISLGMLGDTAARMPSTKRTRLERWTGSGQAWRELRTGQKVARTAVFGGRSVVLLAGAGLSIVVVYALATELLARNSPTVVYGEACKLVKQSDAIKDHLLPPLSFHTSTTLLSTSSAPMTRGRRQRHVSTVEMVDPHSGKEVMLLRFFVEARDKEKDLTFMQNVRGGLEWAYKVTEDKGRELWEEVRGWIEEERAERGYVVAGVDDDSVIDEENDEAEMEHSGPSWFGRAVSSTFGSLSGLTGRGVGILGSATASSSTRREPGTWTSGEIHAELEKDEAGIYQWKTFFVDVPSSQAALRNRVWIIRKRGERMR